MLLFCAMPLISTLASFLRIGTAIVLAWDMLRALSVVADWWAMQGYNEPKLPTWLVLGSETLTFQLAATAVVCISVLLVLGWRTQLMTALAWVSARAFQFAARGTADYHNAVLCVLLFWSLVLPTGAAASVDARAGRRSNLSTNLVRAASMGQDGTVVDPITRTAAHLVAALQDGRAPAG